MTLRIDRDRFAELALAFGAACGPSLHESSPLVVPAEPSPPAAAAHASVGAVDRAPDARRAEGIWAPWFTPGPVASRCDDLPCPAAPLPYPTEERIDFIKGECVRSEQTFRPELFQRFVTCMIDRHGCDPKGVGAVQCLERWSEPPTLDPASEAKCEPIVASCAGPKRSAEARGTLTLDACRGIVSVTSARAEAAMTKCITTFCGDAPKLCANALAP